MMPGCAAGGKLNSRRRARFPIEHRAFSISSPVVMAGGSVAEDHPVAGDQEGNRVGTHGGAGGARGAGISHDGREFAVGDRAAHRDAQQRPPDAHLEIRPGDEYPHAAIGRENVIGQRTGMGRVPNHVRQRPDAAQFGGGGLPVVCVAKRQAADAAR